MSKKVKSSKKTFDEIILSEHDQPFEIPSNWIWVKSDDAVNFVGGGTPPKNKNEYWNGDIPWATVKDIKNRFLSTTINNITSLGLENSSAKVASPNELLLITRMAPGKSVVTEIETSINQDLKIVRPKLRILPYFLWIYYTVNIPLIESISTGTTVKGIRLDKLKGLPLPIPPINEQQRIVEKVEYFLKKIEESQRLIEEAVKTFELRRASILYKALRGEFTSDWRAENPQVESGDLLFERILQERDEIINSLPKTKSRKNKVLEITNDNVPFEIPSSWKWVRLAHLSTKVVDGAHRTPSYVENGIPFLSVKDIKDNKLEFSNAKSISLEDHEDLKKRCFPQKGDMLITKSGTIGRTAIVDCEEEFSLFVSVALIKLSGISVNPRFIEYMIEILVLNNFGGEFVKGSTVKNLHLNELINLPIPLPSLEEQDIIVSKLDNIFYKQNQSLVFLGEAFNKYNDLKGSILSNALRGKLGTNDSSEESAIELLKESLQEQVK